MKNLELKELNLEKVNDIEIEHINGGWFPGLGLIIIGNLIGYGAFMAGYDAAQR